MEVRIRGQMTIADIRQELFEQLHDLETKYAVQSSRGATLYINPTNLNVASRRTWRFTKWASASPQSALIRYDAVCRGGYCEPAVGDAPAWPQAGRSRGRHPLRAVSLRRRPLSQFHAPGFTALRTRFRRYSPRFQVRPRGEANLFD
jgi:hypothetical protein